MLTNDTSLGAKCSAVDMMAAMAPPIILHGLGESFGAMNFVVRALKVADAAVSARGGETMTDHVGRI